MTNENNVLMGCQIFRALLHGHVHSVNTECITTLYLLKGSNNIC